MSWRPQGKNYVQENYAKSRGYTMYLYENADVVSQAPGAQPGGQITGFPTPRLTKVTVARGQSPGSSVTPSHLP